MAKKKSKSKAKSRPKGKATAQTKAAAVLTIQLAYRCYVARCKVYDAYRAMHMKYYDEYEQNEVYANKKTGLKKTDKPSFLGDRDIPLVDGNFEAPYEYNSGYENTSNGYLLLVTCSDFPLGGWADVDLSAVDADVSLLSSVLVNDYVSKFHPENIVTLKNPTVLDFTEAMQKLRRICRANGFLVVYLSTHIMSITNGEKQNKKEKNYFVFRDSTWDTPVETASSCLSLTNFSALMNRVLCKQKTILLNYAHCPRPRPSIFPSAKILYPHDTFLTKLAHMCKCAVIASCSSGTKVKELLRNVPPNLPDLLLPDSPPLQLIPTKQVLLKAASQESAKKTTPHVMNEVKVTKSKSGWFTRKVKESPVHVNPAEIRNKLMTDWNIAPPAELVYSERPIKPGATWSRNREEDNRIEIELPDTKVRNNFLRRLIYWKVKTSLAVPVHFVKKTYRSYKKATASAPCQTSLVSEGHTLFGRALHQAFNGGAMQPDHPVVTVEELFKVVHKAVKDQVEAMKKAAVAGVVVEADKEPDPTVLAPINAINQSPVLIIPRGKQHHLNYLFNPVCFKCGPPAPPEKPFIVRVDNNAVLLEWYNPPFCGVQPSKYKIYMKNKSRNFNNWMEVYYPGDITKTQFLVRDLPMGVSCQFKVQAYNNGGWGGLSEETIFVTPGEETEVVSFENRWKKLEKGGLLAVLDHLDSCGANCEEMRKGLHMVINYGQNGVGFKNARIAMRVAELAIKCIKIFVLDGDVLALSFTTLGWCIRGKPERKARQLCIEQGIVELVQESMTKFRTDGKVMNAIAWLRGTMMKYLSPPSEIEKHPTLNPQPKEPGDLGDDEEDEFAYLDDENEEELEELVGEK